MLIRSLAVLLCCFVMLFQAAPAAAAPYKAWVQLSAMQQEALQPLAGQWDTLPSKLQKNLLHACESYPGFSPEQKKRFQSRLGKWSRLTPEQRKRAREKYKAIRNMPPETREQVRKTMREREAGTVASGVPAR